MIFEGEYRENEYGEIWPYKGRWFRLDGILAFEGECGEDGGPYKGKMYWVFEGTFLNGKPHKGRYTYPDGTIFFEGECCDGKPHEGEWFFQVEYYDRDIVGIFNEISFAGNLHNGKPHKGKWSIDRSLFFEGECRDGKPFNGKMFDMFSFAEESATATFEGRITETHISEFGGPEIVMFFEEDAFHASFIFPIIERSQVWIGQKIMKIFSVLPRLT